MPGGNASGVNERYGLSESQFASLRLFLGSDIPWPPTHPMVNKYAKSVQRPSAPTIHHVGGSQPGGGVLHNNDDADVTP